MEVTFISDTVQRYISRCVLRHRFISSLVQMPGRGFTYGDNLGVELLKPTIWNFSGISPMMCSDDNRGLSWISSVIFFINSVSRSPRQRRLASSSRTYKKCCMRTGEYDASDRRYDYRE